MSKMRAAAEKAIQLDDSFGDAHANLAYVHFFFEYDFRAAEKEFKRAIELSPNDMYAHEMYGWVLVAMKRFDEGIAENERARELNPLFGESNLLLGQSLLYARRYDQAAAQLRNTVELAPDYWPAHDFLGIVYQLQGKYPEAIAEAQKAHQLEGAIAEPLGSLGHAYALQGKTAEARKVVDQLTELSKTDHVPSYHFAVIYAALGEKDQAFAFLEKAYQERSWYPTWLADDPQMDTLRSDPRFKDFLRRFGLPQ
jgi:Flp pilus assembly protein TadD